LQGLLESPRQKHEFAPITDENKKNMFTEIFLCEAEHSLQLSRLQAPALPGLGGIDKNEAACH
jgi:hypothetical protein